MTASSTRTSRCAAGWSGRSIDEQVPAAVALRPGPGQPRGRRERHPASALRRSMRLATALENGVRDLRRAGSDVLLFAFGEPGPAVARDGPGPRADPRLQLGRPCHRRALRLLSSSASGRWRPTTTTGCGTRTGCTCPRPGMRWRRARHSRRSGVGDAGLAHAGRARPRARRSPARAPVARELDAGHLAPWLVRRMRGESSGDDGPAQASRPGCAVPGGGLPSAGNTK